MQSPSLGGFPSLNALFFVFFFCNFFFLIFLKNPKPFSSPPPFFFFWKKSHESGGKKKKANPNTTNSKTCWGAPPTPPCPTPQPHTALGTLGGLQSHRDPQLSPWGVSWAAGGLSVCSMPARSRRAARDAAPCGAVGFNPNPSRWCPRTRSWNWSCWSRSWSWRR